MPGGSKKTTFYLKSGNSLGGRNGSGVKFKEMGSSPLRDPAEGHAEMSEYRHQLTHTQINAKLRKHHMANMPDTYRHGGPKSSRKTAGHFRRKRKKFVEEWRSKFKPIPYEPIEKKTPDPDVVTSEAERTGLLEGVTKEKLDVAEAGDPTSPEKVIDIHKGLTRWSDAAQNVVWTKDPNKPPDVWPYDISDIPETDPRSHEELQKLLKEREKTAPIMKKVKKKGFTMKRKRK